MHDEPKSADIGSDQAPPGLTQLVGVTQFDITPLMTLGEEAFARGDHAAALDYFNTAAAAAPTDSWPRVAEANALRGLGRIAEAEHGYVAILAEHPGQYGALLGLGDLATARGDHLRALDHFTAAAAAAPTNPWPRVEQANAQRSLGRIEAAEAAYLAVLADHPGQFGALLGRGLVASARGQHLAALEHFEAAAAAAPDSPWPRVEQANALRELGRTEAAMAEYAAVLADHPRQFGALLGLGQLARGRGDHVSALEHFSAAAAAAPDNPWPRLEQAKSLRHLGRLPDAEACCHAMLAEHPGQFQALLELGHCAVEQGDPEAALDLFTAADDAAKDSPWPRLEQANILRGLGRPGEAAWLYLAVITDHPGQVQAMLGLGLCARENGDHATAVEHFTAAAAAARADNPWPRLLLAETLCDTGDHDAARHIAQTILAQDRRTGSAWMNLGRTERSAARRSAALEAFASAHEVDPRNPDPLIQMALELRHLGRTAAAQQRLAQALEVDPANWHALHELGELASVGRDPETALALFRQAIALHPRLPWAYLSAARVLSEIGGRREALTLIEQAQALCGAVPELLIGRLELLYEAGEWPQARALARSGSAATPRSFNLWAMWFRFERLLASAADLAACLALAPAATQMERARLCQCRGQAAEEHWNLDEAIAQYEQAKALRKDDAWPLPDLARARMLSLDLAEARATLQRHVWLTAADALQRGRSSNLSQTHLGEILNEFAVDGDALARLVAVKRLPTVARVEALLALVREFPDFTPAAMILLVSLRQAGRLVFDAGEVAAGPSPIPRTIVQYWDSPEPPRDVAELMHGWREAHLQFAYQMFSDAGAQAFLRAHYAPVTLQAYRRAPELAQKSDIFRLAYLFVKGGYYIDADDRCLAALPALMPGQAELVVYQEEYGTVGNNFIAVAPRHPVIGSALDHVVRSINRGDRDILWFSSGPGLLTRALAQNLAHATFQSDLGLKYIKIVSRVEMHQIMAMHCKVAYKQTTRHWSNTSFAKRRINTVSAKS